MAAREFDYKPKAKDEDGNLVFEGTIRIRVLDLQERLDVAKSVKMKVGADGNYDLADNVDTLKQMIGIAKENIVSVNLKAFDENGQEIEITSLEQIEYYAEGLGVLQEIGGIMINGFSLGKRLKSNSPNS